MVLAVTSSTAHSLKLCASETTLRIARVTPARTRASASCRSSYGDVLSVSGVSVLRPTWMSRQRLRQCSLCLDRLFTELASSPAAPVKSSDDPASSYPGGFRLRAILEGYSTKLSGQRWGGGLPKSPFEPTSFRLPYRACSVGYVASKSSKNRPAAGQEANEQLCCGLRLFLAQLFHAKTYAARSLSSQ